jgi:hypothetical protein
MPPRSTSLRIRSTPLESIRVSAAASDVADAVRRALLLVGPPESSYDERPDEDAIAELVTK